ncbi:GNAT family N-acetyltransferase [Ideonella sp. DXS29W]|uniref:GNAT family N-acetyltransferase n=1 Tax=Ideonella lacteola TaxID=2984193 RepID=A0ABU9BNW7_9BURK
MRALAVFEGYADRFAVTEDALLSRGLNAADDAGEMAGAIGVAGAPQFTAFVTEAGRDHRSLSGMAVVVERSFTFDLRPSLLLKELYVDTASRGQGVGSALMEVVLEHARARNASELVWDVLPDNESAKAFYRRCGGAPVTAWERWSWRPSA